MRKNNVLKMMLCIVMLCVVSAFAASASAASSSESEQFLQLINMERAKAGVSAVTIGSQNRNLNSDIELSTVQTNTVGFTQMVVAAYDYFKKHGGGQLAVISSIAGTKGLGAAPSYSATKRYQNTYIDALDQLARMEKLPIVFTDIRPGFVKTDLLKNDKYPMLMSPQYVARKIVKAIERKKRRTVIDWRYAVLVFFWKLIPSFVWRRLPIHN